MKCRFQRLRDELGRRRLRELGLPPPKLKRLTLRIRDGEPPRTVVRAYLGKAADGRPSPQKALAHLLRALGQAQEDLDGRIDEVEGGVFDDSINELKEGRAVIDRLIPILTRTRRKKAKTLPQLKRTVRGEEEE